MPACAGGGGERDAAGEDTVANKTKENFCLDDIS